MNTDNIVMWVILQNNADWDFAGDLEDSKSTSEKYCACSEVILLFQ